MAQHGKTGCGLVFGKLGSEEIRGIWWKILRNVREACDGGRGNIELCWYFARSGTGMYVSPHLQSIFDVQRIYLNIIRPVHVKKKQICCPANVHAVLSIKPWNLAHVFYVPWRRPHLSAFFVCLFCSPDFSSVKIFRKIKKYGPPWPKYFRRKVKKRKPPRRSGLGMGM